MSELRARLRRVAQAVLRKNNPRAFLRTRRLWLEKKFYTQPVSIAALRQQLIDLGVTPGRTLWVQSSWNEFYNVPLKPSEIVDLLRDLLGPAGTLAMPAFPIDQDPSRPFLVDRAPVYTGLLCEVFRRTSGVLRSIHLSSSVCAIGPNANFLIKDHHLTMMPWGADTPFCRLMDVDARMMGLGAGFSSMTPLHAVECLLYYEVPFFRRVFDGMVTYEWKRANGQGGKHAFMRRSGSIRPERVHRAFGTDVLSYAQLSNLKIIAADARPFIERAVELGRRGVTMYVDPAPQKKLFEHQGRKSS